MDFSDIVGIVLAAVLGIAIGCERQIRGKAAGLRTNGLICLGAAIFTIISQKMGAGDTSVTRIAAQIVTGVGFLGAGAIIQDRGGVHGLTTAATIWLVASIGMACGGRMYLLAIISTVIAVIVLTGLVRLEDMIERYKQKKNPQTPPDEQN